MGDLAVVPPEVLRQIVSELPQLEAIRLQRVSRNFRLAAPVEALENLEVAHKLEAALFPESLRLGRCPPECETHDGEHMHVRSRLDATALTDLSPFPRLRSLGFLWESVAGELTPYLKF
ncbi:hypothetical protein WJX81_008234 [Elliptochloris bilobata]|uniref:F-box domain-containing protein n=1 Tax=Elliptochloris bilobata TaxID=381761 RepID=A0AAW1RJ63_9CHLO